MATAHVNRLSPIPLETVKKPTDHPTIVRILAKSAEFAKAMPNVMKPDRFMRIAIGAIRRNPKLLECDPLSLMGSLLVAAQLGLEVNTPLGHFYLIPRYNGKTGKNEADGQIGYKGWVELLNRTGAVKDFSAHTVHENDLFEYELGDNEHITHKPSMGERGAAIAFYVIVKLVNGGVRRRVLSKHDVDQYRKRSKSPNLGPWVTDYNAMALKTTFLRELPWLPLKLELQEAVSYENAIEAQASVRYVETNSQAAVDYTVPEVIEQPAIEQTHTDYLPDYDEPDFEPLPVPEPIKRRAKVTAASAAKPIEPEPVIDVPFDDPEPDGPIVPLVRTPAAPFRSQVQPSAKGELVAQIDKWLANAEMEFEKRGYPDMMAPGRTVQEIYLKLAAEQLVSGEASSYRPRVVEIAKIADNWEALREYLRAAGKAVEADLLGPPQ